MATFRNQLNALLFKRHRTNEKQTEINTSVICSAAMELEYTRFENNIVYYSCN